MLLPNAGAVAGAVEVDNSSTSADHFSHTCRSGCTGFGVVGGQGEADAVGGVDNSPVTLGAIVLDDLRSSLTAFGRASCSIRDIREGIATASVACNAGAGGCSWRPLIRQVHVGMAVSFDLVHVCSLCRAGAGVSR